MSFFDLLFGSLKELYTRPLLFLPKMISVTFWLIPYLLLLGQAKTDMAARTISDQTLLYFGLVLLLSPVWLILDSMYPPLVAQLRKTGRMDFRKALSEVLSKFWKVLGVFLILLVIMTIATLIPIAIISAGIAFALLPLIVIGAALLFLILVVLAVGLYFVPTTVLLEKVGILNAFSSGFALSRKNASMVTLLTVISIAFFAMSFLVEGNMQALGVIGFAVSRYIGGVFTVYLYILNPSAYLEIREAEAKPTKSKSRRK